MPVYEYECPECKRLEDRICPFSKMHVNVPRCNCNGTEKKMELKISKISGHIWKR